MLSFLNNFGLVWLFLLRSLRFWFWEFSLLHLYSLAFVLGAEGQMWWYCWRRWGKPLLVYCAVHPTFFSFAVVHAQVSVQWRECVCLCHECVRCVFPRPLAALMVLSPLGSLSSDSVHFFPIFFANVLQV